MSVLSLDTVLSHYQKHEGKVITFVCVILALYLLAFAAKLTWQLVPVNQPTNNSNVTSLSFNQSSSSSNKGVDINAITQLNLFGNAQAKPQQEVAQQTEEVPETALNLRLLGVVASTIEGRGAAVIEYRNQQNIYGIGEKIESTNASLEEIYSDRVIIKNRLTRETLMLDGIDFKQANQNNRREQQSNTVTRVLPTQRQRPEASALREARQKLAENPDSFMQMISLSPRRVSGQLIGFKVSPGPDSALFIASGLKNGDVVTNLNGIDVTDTSQANRVFSELRNAESLQLDILRDGENVSLDIDLSSAVD